MIKVLLAIIIIILIILCCRPHMRGEGFTVADLRNASFGLSPTQMSYKEFMRRIGGFIPFDKFARIVALKNKMRVGDADIKGVLGD